MRRLIDQFRAYGRLFAADSPASFSRHDSITLLLIIVAWAALVARWDALPLQLWDESRNANNAFEMAKFGHWLVPRYGEIPDHWNTKPPLMIWMMAALMRLGLPFLLAVRLPAMLSALATVLLAWGSLRFVLRDKLAAIVAAFLLLGSLQFMGFHGGRTGDYDCLLAFWITSYILLFWASIEKRQNIDWLCMALAGVAVVMAVLTKSVAGLFGLPGLFVFSLSGGRWRALAGSLKFWGIVLATAILIVGYFVTREQYDPGYLEAIRANDLGGRFNELNDVPPEGPQFYLRILLTKYEPGLLLFGLAWFPLLGQDRRRRSLTFICCLTGALLLVVITASRTKHEWYLIPVLPLFSIAAGVGVSDAWRRLGLWRQEPGRRLQTRFAIAGLVLLLSSGWMLGVFRNQIWSVRNSQLPSASQYWYRQFLEAMPAGKEPLLVVDSGFWTNSRKRPETNQMLHLYARMAALRGVALEVTTPTGAFALGAKVGSCDPDSISVLRQRYVLSLREATRGCFLGEIAGTLTAGSLNDTGLLPGQ